MQAGRLRYGLIALGMVVGMLALPMWPAGESYAATHGPVTALRAAQAAVLIAWSLTIAHVVRSVEILLDARALGYRHGDSTRNDSWSPRFVDLALLTVSGVERSCATWIGCSP
jgi:hypothetical protein